MMTTQITKQQQKQQLPAMSMNEEELFSVLENSIYPGAKRASIKMAINYCQAAGLDIMQKPVHLVPMSVKNAQSGQYEMRDVVMPGIGLYRTQAARSGQYAGVSEPEFGADVTENLGGITITYPRDCKVTVHRQMENGAIVAFTARELWKENYATQKRDSEAPNAMWKKRPYAQLAKCAEAQALRKAFPELGEMPTADEMEGKELAIDTATGEIKRGAEQLPTYADDQMALNLPQWIKMIQAGKASKPQIIAMVSKKYTLTQKQIDSINAISEAVDAELVEATQPEPVDPFVAEMNAAEAK